MANVVKHTNGVDSRNTQTLRDESEDELLSIVAPRRTPRPLSSRPQTARRHSHPEGLDQDVQRQFGSGLAANIAQSPLSFSYTQNTGQVLAARLEAMERSLQSLSAIDEKTNPEVASFTKIANAIRNDTTSGPGYPTTDAAIALLSAPYLDVARPHEVTNRPPSLFRRASSVVSLPLLPNTSDASRSVSGPPVNIPLSQSSLNQLGNFTTFSPLHHLPSKQMGGHAVFTTSLNDPFSVLSLNDIACIVFDTSQQKARLRSILDFISPHCREFIRSRAVHIGRAFSSTTTKDTTISNGISACGVLVEVAHGGLASVWIEASQVLVWGIELIPLVASPSLGLDSASSTVTVTTTTTTSAGAAATTTTTNKDQEEWHMLTRIENEHLVLQRGSSNWMPRVVAAAIVVNASNHLIEAHNKAAIYYMLGYESITGVGLGEMLPQFPEFWEKIDAELKTPGTVIPEQKFRELAGLRGAQFYAPDPDPTAIIAVAKNGEHLGVDIQLRLINNETYVAWLSYSRPAQAPSRDAINKVTPVTDPVPEKLTAVKETIARTESIRNVGAQRRKLKLDDFETLALLGKGAYGDVSLARWRERDCIVVLKSIIKARILIDTWSRDPKLGMIPNEIRIMNDLRSNPHPNIVKMIDFFEDSTYFNVIMVPHGDMKGTDLFDFIEKRPTEFCLKESVKLALQFFAQIVSAVAHLHSMGIVHRDIKDENIIVDEERKVQLIDFGSAAYTKNAPFDIFVGTVDYAAPEILQGTPYSGPPQDMWALGILLYTMIFGENPFHSVEEILRADLPISDDLQCADILRSLLQQDISKRPTADELNKMLRDIDLS